MNYRQFFSANTWWGKALGCFFGYLIAGSAGALFGILIGNFFDKALASFAARPHNSYHEEKRQHVQRIFFKTTFMIMGHIAKADGRVSENDIQMARDMMAEMRLSHHQKIVAQQYFNEGKLPSFDLPPQLAQLHQTCFDNPELLKLFMDIQYRAARAGGLSAKKIQALDAIFKNLGFAPLHQQYRFYEDFNYRRYNNGQKEQSSQQNPYRHGAQITLDQAYSLLDIQRSASQKEVKQAYRRLISRNHPDKLMAQGLPEAMIKMANEKTQKITKAYEAICASKGW